MRSIEQALIAAAERVAVQLPRAHQANCQNSEDLVREAVSWNGVLGRCSGNLPH
jgi:hypothetical protein